MPNELELTEQLRLVSLAAGRASVLSVVLQTWVDLERDLATIAERAYHEGREDGVAGSYVPAGLAAYRYRDEVRRLLEPQNRLFADAGGIARDYLVNNPEGVRLYEEATAAATKGP